jgi:hypothetical protein
MSEFDSDEIANNEPIVTLPDRVKSDITLVIRSPMELTYEHMPRYNLRRRRVDRRQGPWQEQERTYEYELHITAGVAVNSSNR